MDNQVDEVKVEIPADGDAPVAPETPTVAGTAVTEEVPAEETPKAEVE